MGRRGADCRSQFLPFCRLPPGGVGAPEGPARRRERGGGARLSPARHGACPRGPVGPGPASRRARQEGPGVSPACGSAFGPRPVGPRTDAARPGTDLPRGRPGAGLGRHRATCPGRRAALRGRGLRPLRSSRAQRAAGPRRYVPGLGLPRCPPAGPPRGERGRVEPPRFLWAKPRETRAAAGTQSLVGRRGCEPGWRLAKTRPGTRCRPSGDGGVRPAGQRLGCRSGRSHPREELRRIESR